MSTLPEPRMTGPLTGEQPQPRITMQLPNALPTAPLNYTTSTKVPVVIPGSTKNRQHSKRPTETHPHKSRFVLPGALIGGILVVVIASSFVVPLDTSQHPLTIAKVISGIFSTTQDNFINTSLHAITPTATLTINSGDTGGSCAGTDIWSTCATFVTASGIQATGQMQRPIIGSVITQYFGHLEYQLWCGCWKPHTGIDLAAPYGTPIMAADTGQVIWVGWDWSGLGWAVKINHGDYIATIYGHMDHYIVKVGQNVTKGQIIGYEGTTGASTGPHLHFMVLVHNVWVDPLLYVALP